MYRLKRPADRAGRGIECDYRTRVFLRLGAAVSAVVIRIAITRRDINETQLLIGAEQRPGVGCVERVVLALSRFAVLIRATEIPGPGKFSGDCVIGAHHTGRIRQLAVVRHSATDHRHAAHDRRRRCWSIETLFHRT